MYGDESKSRRWIVVVPILLVGVIAIIYWLMFGASDSNAPSTEMDSEKKTASKEIETPETFEERRERVDRDPEFYESKARESPETAQDFYLLGRAYVLMGMKTSAKNSFDKAFEILSMKGIASDRSLAADIVLGRTVTADEESFIRFRKSFIEMTAKDREEKRRKEEEEANKKL